MKDLKEEVKELIEYVEHTHKYSSSKIYELYNKVYNKNEKQSTCVSCLKTRVKLLNKWLQEQPEEVVEEIVNEVEELVDKIPIDTEFEPINSKKSRKNKE